jgi:hypothetical protein
VLVLLLIVGAWLRFWGLGNVGLHGDEETMAMPAMAILEVGQPVLPSGMIYARAPLHTYMMAGSAWLFGESEWALRFPSAVVGSLMGLAAFFMGRRFLPPAFNLAFVATIAMLPAMIEISQTARMYVFFVTCVIMFTACIFRWERDQRVASLAVALVVWALAVQFQSLAILIAPLFFFPGLSRKSWRLLGLGALAFWLAAVLFRLNRRMYGMFYPQEDDRPRLETAVELSPVDIFMYNHRWVTVVGVTVCIALLLPLLVRVIRGRQWHCLPPVLLVAAGLVAMSLLRYHAGGLMLLIGVVFWLRTPVLSRRWLIVALAAAAVITVAHAGLLYASDLFPGRTLIGAMTGYPSVWPTLQLLTFSPVAGVIYAVFLLFVLTRFTRGQPLPIHVLYFVIAVWAPLLMIGYTAWNVPPRYTLGHLPGLLLGTLAGLAYLARAGDPLRQTQSGTFREVAVPAIAAIVLINPIALARTVNSGYELHPDHKGAAEYIKSLQLPPDAILIAEDVLQQTYYLGNVDYYVRERDRSYDFAVVREGRVVDQYTGVPVLGSGEELIDVFEHRGASDVFIIGSGENFRNGVRQFRGRGIQEVLDSGRLEVVYEGRDDKTKVWKLVR